MVGTIGFAGSKARELGTLTKWWARIGAMHALFGALGGASIGFVAASLGMLLAAAAGKASGRMAAALLLPLALADILGVPAKYASRARQVPLSWKHVFPAPMSAALYGGVLGFGIGTTIYLWSFHALLLGIFLIGDVRVGTLAGLAFGLGRALPAILAGLALDADVLGHLVDRMSDFALRRRPVIRALSAAATVGLAWGLAARG